MLGNMASVVDCEPFPSFADITLPKSPNIRLSRSLTPPPSSEKRPRRTGSHRGFVGSIFHSRLGSAPKSPPPPPRTSSPFKNNSWDAASRPTISTPRPIATSIDLNSAATTPRFDEPGKTTPRIIYRNADGYFPTTTPPQSADLPKPAIMNRASLLRPESAMTTAGRAKQIRAAQEMTRAVTDRAARFNLDIPNYDFLELIGKGAFGRVFKGQSKSDKSIVAIKIMDIDSSDYQVAAAQKDQAMKDFVTEISILQSLKESKAKNINLIHEAFNFHSQLWIISEYCPGGSVHTLMRANKEPGLEEKYIIAISRELAVALKYVHEAGVIHRDIKCGNILITQEGQLQLCDFGVSGVLEPNTSKRQTIIGTPYWMAPEIQPFGGTATAYGTEIDCWAFGCTVYEMATGSPPNARVAPGKLHLFLKQAPRLEGEQYSSGLRDLVAFCLVERQDERPNAESILRHPYIANSAKKYPTQSLRQLIERYTAWEASGGQRASLWQPNGASAPTMLGPHEDYSEDDEWNFSTTHEFTDEVLSRFVAEPLDSQEFTAQAEKGTWQPKLPPFERAMQDRRAQRGAANMARLFDESAQPYEYSTGEDQPDESDLMFRRISTMYDNSTETVIDLDAARASQDLSGTMIIADVDTIRAKKAPNFVNFYDDDEEEQEDGSVYYDQGNKRDTRDWTFPSQLTAPARSQEKRPPTLLWSMDEAKQDLKRGHAPNTDANATVAHQRPALLHTTTEPVGSFGDFLHPNAADEAEAPLLSLDPPDRDSLIEMGDELPSLSRQPSIVISESGQSMRTDVTDEEPFSLTEYNDQTIRGKQIPTNRLSLHGHSQSEPTPGDRTSNGLVLGQHGRGISLSSDPEHHRQPRFDANVASHHRNTSVQDSLRQPAPTDEFWETDQSSDVQSRTVEKPLLSSRSEAFDQANWRHYDDWKPNEGRLADLEGPNVQSSDTEEYDSQHGAPSKNHLATPPLTRDSSRRGRRRFESDADSDADTEAYRQRFRHQQRPQHVRTFSFPDPQPPIPAALDDTAEQVVVIDQLGRLLEDFLRGLEKAGSMISDDPQAQQPPRAHINGHERGTQGGSGSGSGSGKELGIGNGIR